MDENLEIKRFKRFIKELKGNEGLAGEFFASISQLNDIKVVMSLASVNNSMYSLFSLKQTVMIIHELYKFINDNYIAKKTTIIPSSAEIIRWQRATTTYKDSLDFLREIRNWGSHYTTKSFLDRLIKLSNSKDEFKEIPFTEVCIKFIKILVFNNASADFKKACLNFVLLLNEITNIYMSYLSKLYKSVTEIFSDKTDSKDGGVEYLKNTLEETQVILRNYLEDLITNFDIWYEKFKDSLVAEMIKEKNN